MLGSPSTTGGENSFHCLLRDTKARGNTLIPSAGFYFYEYNLE